MNTGTAEMDDHELQGLAAPPQQDGDDAPHLPAELCQLFADGGPGRTLSVPLPPGSVVWPDPGYRQHRVPRRPALWVSDEPASPSLWAGVRAEHGRSGLWPVLLDDSTQPWSAGQIAPEPVTDIGTYDAGAFMAEVWADRVTADDDLEDLEPYGRHCPGLAPAGDLTDDPDVVADRCAHGLRDRGLQLGLAVVERGADVLAVMGWQGAINHNPWIAPLSAVLRGWEDRFGVRVVGVGFNTLDLSVAAPPVTTRHALHVAAEHWAFCPDSIFQGPGSLVDYAAQLRGNPTWSFWWD
ncbi:MAG TPA: DUF4253 domain-containing protein [Streptosporangiaceae bacterium]|jgi:hypothetical protein